jgi:glutamyl-tRNA reductase
VARDIGLDLAVEMIELRQVPDYLPLADIVIAATTAPLPIVGKGMVEKAIKDRKHKPMFMIDLSVPRNIEPQVKEISDVYLYGIDDLQSIAAEHKRCRHTAAKQAEIIINAAAEKFIGWLESQNANSTIQAFRQLCEQQRDYALIEALRQLESGKDPKEVLQRFAHVMLNRLIHQPTVQIREASTNGDLGFLTMVRNLYQIGLEQKHEEESLSIL